MVAALGANRQMSLDKDLQANGANTVLCADIRQVLEQAETFITGEVALRFSF